MVSKTKFIIDNETIKKLFLKAGINNVTDIAPLGAGEFNAVFSVTADGKEYALKIAPVAVENILDYEKGMMNAEIYWYKRMRENTPINVPEIFFFDTSKTIIPTEYFIMEKLQGKQLNHFEINESEKKDTTESLAIMTAHMHNVTNDKFGYIQNRLYDDWYQAIRSMTVSLINNCKAKGKKTKRGERLLGYIDKYKEVLIKAECHMVNYDIWPMNIIAGRVNGQIKYWWIDPERCFWGDKMADFICLEMMEPNLAKKTISIEAYNKIANNPVEINAETNIRYGVMMAYMGLLQEVEKYYRYTPTMFGWWRNVITGGFYYYKSGLKILKNAGK